MAKEETALLIKKLEHLLQQERQFLLTGKLAGLAGLVPEKEKIIGKLNTTCDLETGQLEETRQKLKRNGQLLERAMAGLQAIADRMSELRRTRDGLDLYDGAGRRTRYGITRCSRLEKRS